MHSRRIARLLLLVVVSLGFVAVVANASQRPGAREPTVVRPRWHRLAGNVTSVVVGSAYLALTSSIGPHDLSLLQRRTGLRTELTPPGCPNGSMIAGFGGAWLATQCALPDGSEAVDLDDLASGTWTQQLLAPGVCNVEDIACGVNAVGTTWIRFFETEPAGCQNHCASIGYLQNISTGADEPDPADDPSARVVDDLDSSTGVAAHQCPTPPKSAFSTIDDSAAASPSWHQLNGFAFSTGFNPATGLLSDTLYRCGAKHGLKVIQDALSSDTLASPLAVFTQDPGSRGQPLRGLSLPTLRPFVIPRPKGNFVALRNATLFTIDKHSSLWSGTLPRP